MKSFTRESSLTLRTILTSELKTEVPVELAEVITYRAEDTEQPNTLKFKDFSARLVAHGTMEQGLRLIMDELLKAISDRLEPWELVDYLQIPMDEILDAHIDRIKDNIEEIKEFIDYNDDTEEDTEDRVPWN